MDWNNIVFTDEPHFCLQHHDGWIRARTHRSEGLLNCFVMHRHTGLSLGIMFLSGIDFHYRTPLEYIDGTLNVQCFMIQPMVLQNIQRLLSAIFQQDNAQSHVARNVQVFRFTHLIEFLAWPACFPDLSTIKKCVVHLAH
ncbi:transposable element Tcb2 transposase [Trichonephila clavipes]|nr:transposable element Tcb2 transposase [Trichonephila clavipes]